MDSEGWVLADLREEKFFDLTEGAAQLLEGSEPKSEDDREFVKIAVTQGWIER